MSLFIEPVIAFFVMLSYLVASVFWASPLFIGNYSMLRRVEFLSGNPAISFQNCVTSCLSLIVIACGAAIKLFGRKDIFLSQGGQR